MPGRLLVADQEERDWRLVDGIKERQYGPARGYTLEVIDLGEVSGDEYEPDIAQKRYISVNEFQRHTFHPQLDVDQVWLMVKGGRRYKVRTCGSSDPYYCDPLLPGVDTVMVVAGPIAYCDPPGCQDDDQDPGSGFLNSAVEFQALVDGEVTVTVYNRGLFGPEREYYLDARETKSVATPTTGPTPTPFYPPTPTVGPTPVPYYSPTPTLTPTPVPPPTPTLTPTPSPYPGAWVVPEQGTGRFALGGSVDPDLLSGSKPMLRVLEQPAAQSGAWPVRFVLLLKMRPAGS